MQPSKLSARLSAPSLRAPEEPQAEAQLPAGQHQRPIFRRARSAPSRVITGQKSRHPDYVLVFSYMLLYLELGWLVMVIWWSIGRSQQWVST
jgi:hypothetical protein